MIGQATLRSQIKKQLADGKFPHFAILIGPRGSGKKTLLADLFDGIYLEDNKIDSVRKMIEMAYQVDSKVFILPDVDNMSSTAKNALLKVVEECPNNNTFIMTAQASANILNTLRSRAHIYRMGVYNPVEIEQYIEDTFPKDEHKEAIVKSIAETPGEVNMLWNYDVDAFVAFVQSVFDSVEKVSGANAFKISSRLSTKDDDGKWDIALFLKVFSNLCIRNITCHLTEYKPTEILKYGAGCRIASKYIQQLRLATTNKLFLVDSWVLEIRRAWMSLD